MYIVVGDVFELLYAKDSQYDVLVHGCNCFRNFGAGFAKRLREEIPIAYSADQFTEYGSLKKLGTYSYAHTKIDDRSVMIINAYTQYGFGYMYYASDNLADPDNPYRKNKVQLHYSSLRRVLNAISLLESDHILMPAIGCGHAGGDWPTVKSMIDKILGDRATVVLLQ